LSPFPATIVAEFGDYSRQCGQRLMGAKSKFYNDDDDDDDNDAME